MKSAYELAMERLDAEDSGDRKLLTDEQKAEIASLNEACEAKVAEVRILKEGQIATASMAGDLEQAGKLKEELAVDIRRAKADRDAKKEAVRRRG